MNVKAKVQCDKEATNACPELRETDALKAEFRRAAIDAYPELRDLGSHVISSISFEDTAALTKQTVSLGQAVSNIKSKGSVVELRKALRKSCIEFAR